MTSNTRFAVGIHILTLLAQDREEPITSEFMAGSVNTNPVVIRRVLGALRQARLVTSQGGNRGGWRLVREPEEITLADVYAAVEAESLFPLPQRAPNPQCRVGRNIQQALTQHIDAAAQALTAELARTTVADILREVLVAAG
jgi:Rrf2 family protein